MKFELGKVMMTVGANTKLECTSVAEILLGRYANGDWGNLSDDDKQENEIALKQNYRLLGSYEDAIYLMPEQSMNPKDLNICMKWQQLLCLVKNA